MRKPSHLGSNCHPSPPGRASAALDSMGASGGANGRDMGPIVAEGESHGADYARLTATVSGVTESSRVA